MTTPYGINASGQVTIEPCTVMYALGDDGWLHVIKGKRFQCDALEVPGEVVATVLGIECAELALQALPESRKGFVFLGILRKRGSAPAPDDMDAFDGAFSGDARLERGRYRDLFVSAYSARKLEAAKAWKVQHG